MKEFWGWLEAFNTMAVKREEEDEILRIAVGVLHIGNLEFAAGVLVVDERWWRCHFTVAQRQGLKERLPRWVSAKVDILNPWVFGHGVHEGLRGAQELCHGRPRGRPAVLSIISVVSCIAF